MSAAPATRMMRSLRTSGGRDGGSTRSCVAVREEDGREGRDRYEAADRLVHVHEHEEMKEPRERRGDDDDEHEREGTRRRYGRMERRHGDGNGREEHERVIASRVRGDE